MFHGDHVKVVFSVTLLNDIICDKNLFKEQRGISRQLYHRDPQNKTQIPRADDFFIKCQW